MPAVVVATTHGLRAPAGGGPADLGTEDVTALDHRAGRWAAVLSGHRLATADGDQPWAGAAPIDGAPTTCALITSQGVWLGTEEAHLLLARDSGAADVATFDEADGRQDWYTPWGGPPAVRSMAAGRDETLYVNVHVGGIVRSRDAGATWQQTIDIDTDVHQVVVDEATGVVAAALGDSGIAVSTDGGDSWAITAEGMHAGYCRAVAVAGDTLIASASDGPFGGRGALYRRSLTGDGPFTKCGDGLPEWFSGNVDSFWLDAAGADVAAASPDGRLFISSDAGGTWSEAATGLPTVRAVLVR